MDVQTKTALDTAAEAVQALLAREAKSFVEGNSAAVLELGEDQVKAIFSAAAFELVAVPALPPNPSADAIADREEILAKRDANAQLVAAAQLKNNKLSADLRAQAVGTLVKVASGVAGIGFALLKGL